MSLKNANWTDLSGIERDLLAAIRGLELATTNDLEERLDDWYGENRPAYITIYNNLENLVDEELVEKDDHPEDARQKAYTLTHHGEALLDREVRFLARTADLEIREVRDV